MSNISSPKFYVYILARPDGTPFYVGKGRGRRIEKHEQQARLGARSHKCNVIRKIWAEGGSVLRQVVFETDDEDAALAREQELIAFYGRANLTNLTDGGDGVRGYQFTPEARQRISDSNRGRKITDQARANLSAALQGHRHSPETLATLSERARTRARTPEGRAHLLAANRKARAPEARAKISAAMKARHAKPGAAEKHRAARRNLTSEQIREIRQLHAAGMLYRELAARYSLGQTTIAHIVRGETYSDV